MQRQGNSQEPDTCCCGIGDAHLHRKRVGGFASPVAVCVCITAVIPAHRAVCCASRVHGCPGACAIHGVLAVHNVGAHLQLSLTSTPPKCDICLGGARTAICLARAPSSVGNAGAALMPSAPLCCVETFRVPSAGAALPSKASLRSLSPGGRTTRRRTVVAPLVESRVIVEPSRPMVAMLGTVTSPAWF